MTYEEAKKEIAIKHKLGTTLVTGHKASYFEEAALLYADQMKVKNLAQPDVSGMCDFLMWVTNSSYVWHTGEERWTNGYEYISVEQLQEKWQKQKSHFR